MELDDLLRQAMEMKASDVYMIPGSPIRAKAGGKLVSLTEEVCTAPAIQELILHIYERAKREPGDAAKKKDDHFSFALSGVGRFRTSVYRQRGSLAAMLRTVAFGLPDPTAMHIPKAVMQVADYRSGLVLVTGPAGSGRSTTLACLLDRVNQKRSGYIMTMEDPIEFLHPHKGCLVSQREIPSDAADYIGPMKSAIRQGADVIYLAKMEDPELAFLAFSAAESSRLVLTTLHTVGLAKAVDRIADMFPGQEKQVRSQLSTVLRAVVSQQLIPTLGGGVEPIFEVTHVDAAISAMIREGSTHQLDTAAFKGGDTLLGMDIGLVELVRKGRISQETAITYASNPEAVSRRIRKGG